MPKLKLSTAAYSREKSMIKKVLKELGAENVKIDNGYYHFSGFATLPNEKIIYFSFSAPRNEYDRRGDFLIRTAKDYKDYGGGTNTFCKPSPAALRDHIRSHFM